VRVVRLYLSLKGVMGGIKCVKTRYTTRARGKRRVSAIFRTTTEIDYLADRARPAACPASGALAAPPQTLRDAPDPPMKEGLVTRLPLIIVVR
jgi:hypothetical protein